MKFSVSWLKKYLETDISLDDLLSTLNAIGLEVDSVTNPADALAPFTVAEVVATEKHPDADKLKVCTVTTGSEEIQIVCGAPNARAGIKVVLGRPGDYVPGLDVTLKKAKIRGVESVGMMCSFKELELGEDHDGIIELPADAPVGTSYVEYAELDDAVIDIEITPNRQDCLGIYGIARDLAAAGVGTLKAIEAPVVEGSFDSDITVSIDLPEDKASACTQFLGRKFTGIKNGPSPQWLQEQLTAIGLRPISRLVDVTNFVTHAYGRPLHVYDAAKLTGNLKARMGLEGETFTALDDKEYTATAEQVVIADDSGAQGFGGIIGGLDSGCLDDTTDVILEAALFDPKRTAFTGRDQGIITDARYRFERGVDPLFVRDGIEIATRMILDLCGGEVSHVFEAGADTVWDHKVPFRPERIKTLGGVDLPANESFEILKRLGFTVSEAILKNIIAPSEIFDIGVPSWRCDIIGEPDIVEEVLRIHGYDNIPSVQLPELNHKAGTTLSPRQERSRAVKRRLASAGMHEAITWSFMNHTHAELFGGGGADLIVGNPISSELDCMRPSILPNLMAAAQRNKDRGVGGIALFEVGPCYENDTEKGQSLVAAGIRAGAMSERHWANATETVSVYDAKRDALAALEAVGAPTGNLQVFEEAPDYYHPGRSGTLRLGPKNILASFGEIHPKILKALDIDGPIVGFEVLLDKIPGKRSKSSAKAALETSNLQSVARDFAFLIDSDKTVASLIKAVQGADKNFIKGVSVFDIYAGKGVPEGQQSVALSITLEPKAETFSDKDIEAISHKIVTSAEKSIGATLRS
ncbi:MAG: phenylalanine--tRNA ligase subunit beta [Kordiimonadaceae bacterium]|nr:phenylalanine--tRNA ligase subunit beta [Kordiimonadaceae bacterium]